jgi:hypothetical protein
MRRIDIYKRLKKKNLKLIETWKGVMVKKWKPKVIFKYAQ